MNFSITIIFVLLIFERLLNKRIYYRKRKKVIYCFWFMFIYILLFESKKSVIYFIINFDLLEKLKKKLNLSFEMNFG